MDIAALQEAVFATHSDDFEDLALKLFQYQSRYCEVYGSFLEHLKVDPSKIQNTKDIPFLPVSFFKNFEVKTGTFNADIVFESSSTSGTGISNHHVFSANWYKEAFTKSFMHFFGDCRSYCHLALLPSYLERQNSSLVYQIDHFIKQSDYERSAFYLHDHEALSEVLLKNETDKIPTILWGVSYALLDLIETRKFSLKNTMIIETGGMKGRRKEIIRKELHDTLRTGFGVNSIAGEYGMTELMSQAYAIKDGIYRCPPWMRIRIREVNDPLGKPEYEKHGAVNIIDLANLHSCSFLAVSDLGRQNTDDSFEILGRMDHSDIRGCNLLV